MNLDDKNSLEYLKKKYAKNERILIKAYEQIKKREEELKNLNNDLQTSEEELRASNEEVNAINDELLKKNKIIKKQNKKLKETLRELKDTQLQLFQAEKMASLGILTAGVAHELNNPLNFINAGTIAIENYINSEQTEHYEHIKSLISKIKIGVVRASGIVQSLNHFSHHSSTSSEITDIHTILTNCITILNNKIKHKIKVKTNFTKQSYILIASEGELHQLFINILANAIQSIEEKGIIEISTYLKGKRIFIAINDNGCGIETENLKRIMDPFFTTKPPGKGTGLGLAISYSIVSKFNGDINFESKIGEGTKVTISFPI